MGAMPIRFPRPWGNHYSDNSVTILILYERKMKLKLKNVWPFPKEQPVKGTEWMGSIIGDTTTANTGIMDLKADPAAWPFPTSDNLGVLNATTGDFTIKQGPGNDFEVVPSCEPLKLLATKPQYDPVKVLTDKIDGIHPMRRETDPYGKDQNAPGAKVDAGKNRVWLCLGGFSNALEQVAKITTIGATKYTPNGWVTVPNAKERYMDAFGRHMLALGKGEVYDNGEGGTGGKHIAQMIWNLLAVLELEEREEKK